MSPPRLPARVVFMGTPAFAAASLRACLEVAEVVAVVTQPDKPRGRGQEVSFSPVKALALERGLPVLQPMKLRGTDFAQVLAAYRPDFCVVTAYGKILPPDVLAVPPRGCLNVHASLLPRFRGAAPIQWAIAAGDARTGVCLMQMDEGMDTGPVLACDELEIGPEETSGSLHDRLAELGRGLLVRCLPLFWEGKLVPHPQPEVGAVSAPMLKKEDGRLDFHRPARELERRVRAFDPWPSVYTRFEGALLKVKRARAVEGRGAPGEVLSVGSEGIAVACGEGALLLVQVQPEGKRVMGGGEFAAGRKIAVGALPFAALS